MKKITFLRLKKNKFGGAENYLVRLSKGLQKLGIEVEIKYSTAPKFLASWMKAIWYNLEVCLNKKDKFYFSLERVICPDIYRAGDGVHKVFLEVENKSKFNPLHLVYLFIEKRMFKNAKKIIANSQMVKQQIINTYKINPEKIKVIYNGVPIKELANFDDIKKEFNIQNEKILLYVGSGFKRKGVEEVLEIASKLKNYKLFIVGKEKNMNYYKNLAKKLNVNAIFTGPRSDVDKFYSMADIFIFPTHYEPFSNVVLEAMSYKCAVFTTAQNGASEILDEKFIMQNPKDYKINLIQKLLDDEKYLNEIKEKNYQIAKNFSIEKNVEETLKVINETIN
jgi:UDP-glucose:(heptosyl)LPS alpha-1,3-glucosyltransferase